MTSRLLWTAPNNTPWLERHVGVAGAPSTVQAVVDPHGPTDLSGPHQPTLTAKGVPRRSDVPAAGRALGVELPEWVRSAADVGAGFAATLNGLFDDNEEAETLEIGRLALTVLASDSAPTGDELARAVSHAVLDARLHGIFDRGFGTREIRRR